MKPSRINLTYPQFHLVRQLIKQACDMGDCTLRGFWLTFPDYEGALAFRNKVMGLQANATSTTAYISLESIVKKIDAAIRRGVEP